MCTGDSWNFERATERASPGPFDLWRSKTKCKTSAVRNWLRSNGEPNGSNKTSKGISRAPNRLKVFDLNVIVDRKISFHVNGVNTIRER